MEDQNKKPMWYNKKIYIDRMKNKTNNLPSEEQFSVYKACLKVTSYLRQIKEGFLSPFTNDKER